MKKLLIVFILLFSFFNVLAAPVNDGIENTEVSENNLNITKFEIIGFNINFNVSKYEYTINIPDIINKINIVVEGDNIEVIGAGTIDITDLSETVVTIKSGDIEQNYTINLVRQDMSLVDNNNNNEKTLVSDSEYNIFVVILLIITVILLVVTAILVILLKKKKEHEIEIL
ncbi:MAG: hypothetical protein IKN63_02965 [Bacilli bacterium]|nr:hypothetical protein [Bacilli bacterium]